MRTKFPAHFRPSPEELGKMWSEAVFALDANVLLNLYRYSMQTREELEQALDSIKESIFLPHQAASEYLKNRLNVTANQADEYTEAIESLNRLSDKLIDTKRHPFIADKSLPVFRKYVESLVEELEKRRKLLLDRLTDDERLTYIEKLFDGRTGGPLNDDELQAIAREGEERYERRVPPGFRDADKHSTSDPYAKFGDLIMWKQLIRHGKKTKRPLILISDDSKEDWWLRQSGRTIGPLVELREEFLNSTNSDFWMYSVEAFLELSAESRNQKVSDDVIAEVVEISSQTKKRGLRESSIYFKDITEKEMIQRLESSEKWAMEHEGFVGLHNFITYLKGYNFATSYEVIESLEKKGVVEVYDHKGPGHERPVRAVRLVEGLLARSEPYRELRERQKILHYEIALLNGANFALEVPPSLPESLLSDNLLERSFTMLN